MQGWMRSYMWLSFKITAFWNVMNRKAPVPLCNFTNLGQLPKTTLQKKGWLLRCIWWLPIFSHMITETTPVLQTPTRHGKQSDRLLHLTVPNFPVRCGLHCFKCQCPLTLSQSCLGLLGEPYLDVCKPVQALTWHHEFFFQCYLSETSSLLCLALSSHHVFVVFFLDIFFTLCLPLLCTWLKPSLSFTWF